jgi:hypothetical protein
MPYLENYVLLNPGVQALKAIGIIQKPTAAE